MTDKVPLPRPGSLGLIQYAGVDMHAYAAAVSAADNAALREINAALCAKSNSYIVWNARLEERVKVLEDALLKSIVQNECDMLLTGDELRAARAALDNT